MVIKNSMTRMNLTTTFQHEKFNRIVFAYVVALLEAPSIRSRLYREKVSDFGDHFLFGAP